MPYYSIRTKCPECKNEQHLYTIELPRSDKTYTYDCNGCGDRIAFLGGAGIEVESIPENATIANVV